MERGKSIVRLRGGALPQVRTKGLLVGLFGMALCLLLSQVDVFLGYTPLAAALYAGMDMAGYSPWLPLAGAAAGAFLHPEPNWTAVMAAGLYLFLRLGVTAVRTRPPAAHKQAVLLLSELIPYLLLQLDTANTALFGFFSMSMTLLLSCVLRRGVMALRGVLAQKRLNGEAQLALCLLLCCLLPALSPLSIGTFSPAITLACFVCLQAARLKGMKAVALAAALAAVTVLCGGAGGMFIANLTVCTLIGALFRPFGRWGVALGFGICGLMAVGGIQSVEQTLGAANLFAGVVAYMVTPKDWLLPVTAAVDAGAARERAERSALQRFRRETVNNLYQTAQTVAHMAALLSDGSVQEQEAEPPGQDWRLSAVQRVCSDCLHRAHCYRMPEQALEAMEQMLADHENGARPQPGSPLLSTCSRTEQLCSALAQAEAQRQQHRMLAKREQAGRAFYQRQIAAVGCVMRNIAAQAEGGGYYDAKAEAAVHRRLEEAGLRPRGVSVQKSPVGKRVTLTLHKSTQKRHEDAAEIARRGVKSKLRLLSSEEEGKRRVLRFEEAGQIRVTAGVAVFPGRRGMPSGDSVGHKALAGGGELFIISDGMGSGAAAEKQSRAAVDMMTELFGAGFAERPALECVNRLLLRRGGRDMYATVDALHLNVRTGQAMFMKYGAPPSFILRGGGILRVEAEALPAGVLEEAAPAVCTRSLRRGDTVVMLSDGVLDALEHDMERVLMHITRTANNAKEAANALVYAAQKSAAVPDDRTAIVLRLE